MGAKDYNPNYLAYTAAKAEWTAHSQKAMPRLKFAVIFTDRCDLVVLLGVSQQGGLHVDVKLLAVRLFIAAC